ncbi:hypothetical protein B296_00039220 [Ensete ventricosum]|uniref:Uncharacterized protein n=1 Tax=Ensete ventricosum TaxID=4639 RepID=A0A426XSY0_ENSVE|nr:hypothetical protein B296_00039220 [Ensete ventricosum]
MPKKIVRLEISQWSSAFFLSPWSGSCKKRPSSGESLPMRSAPQLKARGRARGVGTGVVDGTMWIFAIRSSLYPISTQVPYN